MQNRFLLMIVFILSIVNVVISSSSNTTIFYSSSLKKEIRVKDDKSNNINSIDLEDYIIGVVAAEMPASFAEEALKAQAIAARTYATFKMQKNSNDFDVVTSVVNQGFITNEEMKKKWNDDYDKYYEKIKNAVNSTKGKVMYYNDEIVEAYYFALSNGYTEDVSLVFSENKDYLQSVRSTYDEKTKNFEVTKVFSKNEICNKLGVSCEELKFSNIKRSDTHRVNEITVNNKVFKGTTFRSKLKLRSTDFTINDNSDGTITITTRGYGHGVGMSQYGANGMAKDGYSYEEILKYFYKNIKISSI